MGITLFYLTLMLILPVAALAIFAAGRMSWAEFISLGITDSRVTAAYRLSFLTALIAALINGFGGLLLAWILVRYSFPGRRLVDALVDLPFALPTAVAGIALTSLYAPNGPLGAWLVPLGIEVAYAPAGIVVALTLVGLPFVVRTVQPALADLDAEVEEAARSLGASGFEIFRRVIFPAILPAWITGMTMAFARALGEFGSVYFIAGNRPYYTEIAPLLIAARLESFEYEGATAVGLVMLIAALVMLLLINSLQAWSRRNMG